MTEFPSAAWSVCCWNYRRTKNTVECLLAFWMQRQTGGRYSGIIYKVDNEEKIDESAMQLSCDAKSCYEHTSGTTALLLRCSKPISPLTSMA
jgi:hypothetical protein